MTITPKKTTRLNKYLVETGTLTSRRAADQAIDNGKVLVNNKVAFLGQVVTSDDAIKVNGQIVDSRDHITIALYKPIGYICSHTQQGVSPTIFSLLPKTFNQLKIAGRLDKESEGLLILSSNGDIVFQLTHPSNKITKNYIVEIDKPLTKIDQRRLEKGVVLNDGVSTFVHTNFLAPTRIKVALQSGRNRQIRRTFAQLGYGVTRLIRTGEAGVTLGALKPGDFRFVTPSELML